MAVYATNGSINVTVVDGSTRTGLYAADGSINVVKSNGSGYKGLYHPCGAWYVTPVTGGMLGYYAADGSVNVAETPFTASGAVRVTVVSGTLSGGGGTGYLPFGLLTTYFG